MDVGIALLIGSIITAVVGAASNGFNAWYQNDYNEKMWNKYSSPQAQYQQLTEAGVSPAAAAQSIAGVGGGAGTIIQAAQPASTDFGSIFGNLANSFLDSKRVANETKLTDAQVKEAFANVKKTLQDTLKSEADTELVKKQISWFDVQQQSVLALNDQQRSLWQQEISKLEAEGNKIKAETDYLNKLGLKVVAETSNVTKVGEKLDYEIKILDKQGNLIDSQEALNRALAFEAREKGNNEMKQGILLNDEISFNEYKDAAYKYAEAVANYQMNFLKEHKMPDYMLQFYIGATIDGFNALGNVIGSVTRIPGLGGSPAPVRGYRSY